MNTRVTQAMIDAGLVVAANMINKWYTGDDSIVEEIYLAMENARVVPVDTPQATPDSDFPWVDPDPDEPAKAFT